MLSLSLVICSRDRARQLAVTLDRLAGERPAAHGVEVLLVGGDSKDDTIEVMRTHAARPEIAGRVVVSETPGLGRARNAGVKSASGEMIVFTDDDCYLSAGYFDALRASFDPRRHDYGTASILLFDPRDDPRVANMSIGRAEEIAPGSLLRTGTVQGANMFFRRAVFDAAGLFDEHAPAEDIEMATRASLRGFRGVRLPAPAVFHDHGRRRGSPEADETVRAYDRGRGAYYASLLARGVPGAWDLWRASRGIHAPLSPGDLGALARELEGAAAYLKARGGD